MKTVQSTPKTYTSIRTIIAAAITLLPLMAINDAQACAACGCTISKDWGTQGITTTPGFSADLSFSYINQNQHRLGTGTASSDQLIALGGAGQEIEENFRESIRLNARFTAAYQQLASVLEGQSHFSDAKAILKEISKITTNPRELARAQQEIKQIESIEASQSRPAFTPATESGRVAYVEGQEVGAGEATHPKHPAEDPNGPKHEVIGIIKGVKCSYPSVIDFRVESSTKSVALYSNNFYKVEFSSLGFTPDGTLNPCSGIEGMKARVQYADSSDKTVVGQVVEVELRK